MTRGGHAVHPRVLQRAEQIEHGDGGGGTRHPGLRVIVAYDQEVGQGQGQGQGQG